MAILRTILRAPLTPILVSLLSRYGSTDLTPPTFVSAEVGNVADDLLVITMSENMDESIVSATTVFTVDDGAANAVTNVDIAGPLIKLTLTNSIGAGDTVTVAYTKPGSNPLSDISGNEAESWSAESVTNNSAQYIEYTNVLVATPAETIYTDGTTSVRKKITGNTYQVDVTLTPTGFAGAENMDWVWLFKKTGQTAVFRSGVRAGDFVVDGTIDGTGFAGTINVNWENLDTAEGTGVLTTYRDGARDESYVIDKALTATGFAGSENTDWKNLRKYKPE